MKIFPRLLTKTMMTLVSTPLKTISLPSMMNPHCLPSLFHSSKINRCLVLPAPLFLGGIWYHTGGADIVSPAY